MTLSLGGFWPFLLVLIRLSGLVAIAPLFSSQIGSPRLKVGMLLILSAFVSSTLPNMPKTLGTMDVAIPALIGEFVVGLFLGMGFRLALSAVTMAGEIAGLQMGIGAASLIDQNSGQNAALLENFYGMMFTVLFISLDGHHHMLRVLRESFLAFPVASALTQPLPVEMLIVHSTETLACGLKLAAPIVVPLLLLTVAMAMVSRAFPQANIYSISYGVSMLAGIAFLAAATPGMREAVWELMKQADRHALRFVHSMT